MRSMLIMWFKFDSANSYVLPALDLFSELRSERRMVLVSETERLAASTVRALIVTVTEEAIGLSLHTETSISSSDSDAMNASWLKLMSKTIDKQ